MELKNFISNCRNPKLIPNKLGKPIFVRCGKCSDCLNTKAVGYTSMTMNASQEYRYCYMITLKYDEINVPRMLLIEKDDLIYCKDITKRPLKTKGKYKYLKTYGQIINSFPKDEHFEEFYKKADITSKLVEKRPYKNLRWCCAEDLQNFIKRLRFRFSQVLDSSFSFFAVSEYGPRTFRPHFHVLLFFDDWRMWQYLREFIVKSWQLGSVRTECPQSDEGVCSYVASYLNSVTHLPHYLDSKLTRPRSFHSHFLGARSHSEIRDYVYASNGYPFEKVNVNTSFGSRDIILTSSLVRSLFPRCYNFEQQNTAGRNKLYKIYREVVSKYKIDNLVELTKMVIYYPEDNKYFLRLLDIPYMDIINKEYFKCYQLGIFKSHDELPEQLITYFTRIYTALLTSRHVYNFCLAKYEPLMYLFGYDSSLLVRKFIEYVDTFYKERDKFMLHQQLIKQEEYSKLFPVSSIKVDISNFSFVDILHLIRQQEDISHEHFRIFYPIGTIDYKKRYYDTNFIIKNINYEKDTHYADKVKHKELNDENLIFVE